MMLEALAARLVSASVGTLGGSIFIGLMPDKPDACVCLYEYAGAPPVETLQDGGFSLDRPSVQLMSRAGRNDYPVARALIVAARDALVGVANEELSGVRFLRVRETHAINSLGPDDEDRPLFSLSMDVVVE